LGFWAIGTGANGAISSLAHSVEYHSMGSHSPVPDVLYHVLAAKFMSESAQDVGRGTFIAVLEKSDKLKFLSDTGLVKVRKAWEQDGAPKVPNKVTELIKANLFSPGEKKKKKTPKEADAPSPK
jgi:hypothetical protein